MAFTIYFLESITSKILLYIMQLQIHNFFGPNVFCNNSSKLVLFQRQEDSCDKLFAKVRRQTSPAGMQGKIGHRVRVCCQKKMQVDKYPRFVCKVDCLGNILEC